MSAPYREMKLVPPEHPRSMAEELRMASRHPEPTVEARRVVDFLHEACLQCAARGLQRVCQLRDGEWRWTVRPPEPEVRDRHVAEQVVMMLEAEGLSAGHDGQPPYFFTVSWELTWRQRLRAWWRRRRGGA